MSSAIHLWPGYTKKNGQRRRRLRDEGPGHPGRGRRLRGAVAGAARPLLEDGERPGRSAADGGADRERTGRGVGHLRPAQVGPGATPAISPSGLLLILTVSPLELTSPTRVGGGLSAG